MKNPQLAFFLSLILGFGACVGPLKPIPSGSYKSSIGSRWINVSTNNITFHLESDTSHEATYRYTLRPSGRIQIFLERSVEVLSEVGRSDFYWDGKSIIQVDLRKNTTNSFNMVTTR
jgi:hypothetical protein